MKEVHDTVRQLDTVLVNNTVRLYTKSDTVFRDSIRTVYLSSRSEHKATAKATADSVRTVLKTTVETQYKTPDWVWKQIAGCAAALLTLAATLITMIIKKRKTN